MSRYYTMATEKSFRDTRGDLEATFTKWRVRDWNIINHDDARGTITVRYTHPGGQEVRLTMGNHRGAENNLRVLYLALEAMRLNEVRGLAEIMQEAYLQLPAGPLHRDPYETLGVRPDADMAVIEAAYRAKAKTAHPDAGGSDEEMAEINEALERVRKERSA